MTDAHYQDVLDAMRRLGKFATDVTPSKIPLEPTRGDVFEAVHDLRLLASRVDAVLEAYAAYVENSTGFKIEQDDRFLIVTRAIDGNLLYEIECAADYARDRLMEAS